MTAPSGPAERPPWFHVPCPPGPGDAVSEEARRWQELAEASERSRRHVRGREGEGRWPAPNPGVAVGFWSPTPILGFRFWYVLSEHLKGVRQIWERPELKAWCERRGPGAPHAGGGCPCGIYALKAPEGLPRPETARLRPGTGIAYGVVALSGVVVEHERGYRAARAEAVAVAALCWGRALGGSDRWWIRRLFQRPACALEEGESGLWPGVKPMEPTTETVVGFLRDKARRFEQAWTSASRSG
jgi:hypothetical protein